MELSVAVITSINGKIRILPIPYNTREKISLSNAPNVAKLTKVRVDPNTKDKFNFIIQGIAEHLSKRYDDITSHIDFYDLDIFFFHRR